MPDIKQRNHWFKSEGYGWLSGAKFPAQYLIQTGWPSVNVYRTKASVDPSSLQIPSTKHPFTGPAHRISNRNGNTRVYRNPRVSIPKDPRTDYRGSLSNRPGPCRPDLNNLATGFELIGHRKVVGHKLPNDVRTDTVSDTDNRFSTVSDTDTDNRFR